MTVGVACALSPMVYTSRPSYEPGPAVIVFYLFEWDPCDFHLVFKVLSMNCCKVTTHQNVLRRKTEWWGVGGGTCNLPSLFCWLVHGRGWGQPGGLGDQLGHVSLFSTSPCSGLFSVWRIQVVSDEKRWHHCFFSSQTASELMSSKTILYHEFQRDHVN